METVELLEIAGRGEDTRHQFKADVTNAVSLASEIVAFANSGGGQLLIGVADDGSIEALDATDIQRINQLIGNAASTQIRPAINPVTENVPVANGIVVVVTIPDGIAKPYMDNSGAIWVKSGSDKRKVTAREEMQRMFQAAQLVHGDDIPVTGSSIADIDLDYFRRFYSSRYERKLDQQELSLGQVLTNMRLVNNGVLTVAGALLFAREPQVFLPVFHVKAVCYPGNDIHVTTYLDSVDITGKLQAQFDDALGFITRNLRRDQGEQGVNTTGELEIPRIVLEELLANALMHRDYFVSAPIRVFVFDDRVEIISPGHLPNNLTVANIQTGNSNIRNPILASFATKLLPYRGLGTGILRALREYPSIEFENDRDGNLFRATIRRHPR
ncbi:RNA-binding domain-containing protein [Terracidiphilus sp.]|uniref:RNA-binding domain-containing protein n=1 Tax=Terracidiphilus sp. TaxID=1964191 RepID=UPI003C196229